MRQDTKVEHLYHFDNIDNKTSQVVKPMSHWIKLTPTYIEYKTACKYNSIDEDGIVGQELNYSNYQAVVKRKDIFAVEILWNNEKMCWGVCVMVGTLDTIGAEFISKEEADEVYNLLRDYHLNLIL